MNIEAKIKLIEHGTLEIVTMDNLKELLKEKEVFKEQSTEEKLIKEEQKEPIAYTGYEPSGKIHLGHAITVEKLKQLQNMGFKIKILLADYHAYLNGKGTLKEIKEIGKYNELCFKALGLDETTEFIYGSDFQTTPEYTDDLYQLATLTTIDRAKRSMDQVSRHSESPKVANVIYPLMQVIDMLFLEVDVALGGMEQRKIQMLARENLPKIVNEVGKKAPICIHTPLLHGLDGDDKMSSSKGNFIAIDDTPDDIVTKINKSYCPINEIEGNPIIELANHFIFTHQDTIIIERPEKFGGNLELNEKELIDTYTAGELHPADLKSALASFLVEYLKPIREYMSKHS